MTLFQGEEELAYCPGEPQWGKEESVLDPQAAESVAPPSLAHWIDASESDGSNRGPKYVSPSGKRIPNLREKKLRVVTEDGSEATVFPNGQCGATIVFCVEGVRYRKQCYIRSPWWVY